MNTIGAAFATQAAYPSRGGASASALQGQLARYQQELSDCVNCASSKTLEGKQKIQQISEKISDLKARIETADASSASKAPDRQAASESSSNLAARPDALGAVVDVYA
jgi:hypothetical protein